jgi:hypothetical protein
MNGREALDFQPFFRLTFSIAGGHLQEIPEQQAARVKPKGDVTGRRNAGLRHPARRKTQ